MDGFDRAANQVGEKHKEKTPKSKEKNCVN